MDFPTKITIDGTEWWVQRGEMSMDFGEPVMRLHLDLFAYEGDVKKQVTGSPTPFKTSLRRQFNLEAE